MIKRFLILVLIMGLPVVGTAFAQLTPTARINGRVIDDQGGPGHV